MRRPGHILFSILLLATVCGCKGTSGMAGDEVKGGAMHIEHLPDLNIPRHAHALMELNGELTVIGGHTTGFIPTPTAEYFKNGKWHTVESIYPHDYAVVTILPDGKVLVAGGMGEPFGKGRSLGAELYDPSTHSFSPLPILDKARTRASATVLSDGTIVVSGNWYGEDNIATYSLEEGGIFVKDADQPRCNPYILPCAADNALILSSRDPRDSSAGTVMIDRLRGEPFTDSLFSRWRPARFEANYRQESFFIGDEALGGYTSLITVNSLTDGQVAVVKQTGEHFSMLETESPIPMTEHDGVPVLWGLLHADKTTGQAYLAGISADMEHICVCIIGYDEALRGKKAPIKLLAVDSFFRGWDLYHILLPGGRIAFAGGNGGSNYDPIGTAFILHTEPFRKEAAIPLWPLLLLGAAICALALWLTLKKKPSETPPMPEYRYPVPSQGADLASRIATLMEQKQLFRRKGLKVQDIATELGTNSTYISACTNGQWGMSFPEYLSSLRIRYSLKLMGEHPDMPLHRVADEAGFSSEQSFFRSFKSATGQTPAEWREHHD